MDLAALFKEDRSVVQPREPAGKRRLAVDRFRGHDLRQPTGEPPIIRLVPERPIEPRGGHFKRVRPSERRLLQLVFLDVEQCAQIVTHPLAVCDPNGVFFGGRGRPWVRSIDDDAQDRADRLAAELHVENLKPVASCHPFRRIADAGEL